MTEDRPAVTCVVVAFHRPDSLRSLLADLRHDAIEVVVVNVETDPGISAVALGSAEIPVDDNVGYACAVNAGVERASAPVVVFMNDDVRADAQVVLDIAAAVRPGQVDVVVPRVVTTDGRTERTISALPTAASLAREWLVLPDRPVRVLRDRIRVQKWRLPESPEQVQGAAAVVVGATTSLMREIPLPEDYFLYWEEAEWFWSLREAGIAVEYRPEVVVTHEGGTGDIRPEKSRLLARNAVRCVRRTQGRSHAGVAALVVVLWNLRLVLVDGTRAAMVRDRARLAIVKARLAGLAAAVGAWREVVTRT